MRRLGYDGVVRRPLVPCVLVLLLVLAPQAMAQIAVPQVHVGRATVRGSLSSEIVARVVRRHLNELRYCYEVQLQQRPDVKGTIVVQFVVRADGDVAASQVSESNTGAAALDACAAQAARRWTFPATGAGIAIVRVPFTFSVPVVPHGHGGMSGR